MAIRWTCWCWCHTPSFSGCVHEVRPIGLMEMLDQGVLDEKVLAVGNNNPRYNNVWNYTDIYPHMLKEITHFFSIYKDLEGKRVEIKGWHDASYARDHIVRSIKQFEDNKLKKAKRPEVEGAEYGNAQVALD
jgi:inorganic pyrophosphatase